MFILLTIKKKIKDALFSKAFYSQLGFFISCTTHDVIFIYHLVMKTVLYKFLIIIIIIIIIIIMFSKIYVSIF